MDAYNTQITSTLVGFTSFLWRVAKKKTENNKNTNAETRRQCAVLNLISSDKWIAVNQISHLESQSESIVQRLVHAKVPAFGGRQQAQSVYSISSVRGISQRTIQVQYYFMQMP